MPKWGLTEHQQRSKPWGLDEKWLLPAKTITDAVHGDVYINELEHAFLDSAPLQRLRRVRQLGTTYLVYPAATHVRLSHALGALRSAQDLIDAIVGNRESPRHSQDLFDKWERDARAAYAGAQGAEDESEDTYAARILAFRLAEATVLARLGALLHDLCHVPFGHTIEDDLKVLTPHDANAARFERLWMELPPEPRLAVSGPLATELRALILSKEKPLEPGEAVDAPQPGGPPPRRSADWRSRYPFVADVVGNTICADLLDYIRRDHLFTGLPIAVGDRFADDFYVVGDHVHYGERMAIRVTRHGKARSDVVTELLKYLRYRYELSERALYHHAKVAGDAVIAKLLEMWGDAAWVDKAKRSLPALLEVDASDLDSFRSTVAEHGGDREAIERESKAHLDEQFTRWSDDGLLEHLRDVSETRRATDRRWDAIYELASAVLNRQLFKPLGWADGADAHAVSEPLYDRYRRPDDRRVLERDTAYFAGLDRRFHVVLWVPDPDMKLKVAGVLVDANDQIMPLAQYQKAGEEIVEAHRALWAVGVYGHPTVRDDRRRSDAVLAFLSDRMGVTFRRHDGGAVGSPRELAIQRLSDKRGMTADARAQLRDLVPAAKGFTDTYAELETLVQTTAEESGLLGAPD